MNSYYQLIYDDTADQNKRLMDFIDYGDPCYAPDVLRAKIYLAGCYPDITTNFRSSCRLIEKAERIKRGLSK